MTTSRVMGRCDLHGADEFDLIRRIDALCGAVRAQRGTILGIEWQDGAKGLSRGASIHYELNPPNPSASTRIERNETFPPGDRD